MKHLKIAILFTFIYFGNAAAQGVTSFNTRTGAVTLQSGDVTSALGYAAAQSGANSNITSLSGLTTPLSASQGGTGASSLNTALVTSSFPSASPANLQKRFSQVANVVVDFGAICDGAPHTTTNATAFANAFASGAKTVVVPAGSNCVIGTSTAASGLMVPDGATLQGLSFSANPNTFSSSSSTITCFSALSAPCVTVSNNDNGAADINNLAVEFSGAPMSGDIGVKINGAANAITYNLFVFNAYDGIYYYGGQTSGVYNSGHDLYTAKISDAHLVCDGCVGLHVNNAWLGTVGAFDVASKEYLLIKGGNINNNNAGPTTVYLSQIHSNQGQNVAACWINFTNLAGVVPTYNATEFYITQSHVEAVTNGICSDSTWNEIDRLVITNSTYNQGSGAFFNLSPSTIPSNWLFDADQLFATSFTLAPTSGQILHLIISNSTLGGTSSFTSSTSGSLIVLGDNIYYNNVKASGAFGEFTLTGQFSGGAFVNAITGGVWNVALPNITNTNSNSFANNVSSYYQMYPGTGGSGSQTGGGWLANTGNPASGVGNNGDYYMRTDCTHGSSDCIWHKEAGAWQDLN